MDDYLYFLDRVVCPECGWKVECGSRAYASREELLKHHQIVFASHKRFDADLGYIICDGDSLAVGITALPIKSVADLTRS